MRDRQKIHIAGYDDTISILRKVSIQSRSLSQVSAEASSIRETAQRLQDAAVSEHQGLRRCQMEIHSIMANFIQISQKIRIESMNELPEDIQQRVKNRDLFCAKLSKNIRSYLTQLLNSALKEVETAKKSVTRLASKLICLEDRNQKLDQALKSSSLCTEKYNCSHCDGTESKQSSLLETSLTSRPLQRMSSSSSRLSSEALTEPVAYAVAMYDCWHSTYFLRDDSAKSDGAMEKLRKQIVEDASAVMGLSCQNSQTSILEISFQNAGSAISEEHNNQLNDIMAAFPSDLILHAGRRLLEEWQNETKEITRVLLVCQKFESFLAECEGLAGPGKLFEERENAIQQFKSAKKAHETAAGLLMVAEIIHSSGGGGVATATGMTNLPRIEDTRKKVRETVSELSKSIFKLIGDVQPLFPEVILFIGQGLPSELGVLWRPAQTLDEFEEKIPIDNGSRHSVWKVRDGCKWYAVKEYRVSNPNGLRTCIKEAAIIYRHRHQCIVELHALFQCSHTSAFFIQMPWYEYGTLDTWVESAQQPEWNQVRAVLFDALTGLAHLHAGRVIHGDVKPQNILVDSRERGRLADFDISIDTCMRTSTSWIASHTSIGFTLGYQAPELSSEGKASEKTDIYAFGKTIASMERFCEPRDQTADSEGNGNQQLVNKSQGQTKVILEMLTKTEPSDRPNASTALNLQFFAILSDVCKVDPKCCILCSLSDENCNQKSQRGSMCSDGHFHCEQCLTDLTKYLLRIENGVLLQRREARVMCSKFPTECTAPGFSDKELAIHLPGSIFQEYLCARIELLVTKAEAQQEEQVKLEVEAELQRLREMNEIEQNVLRARKYIEEELMQMKCPRCSKAFF